MDKKENLPIIFESDTSNLVHDRDKPKTAVSIPRNLPRLIFFILGAIIIVEVIVGIRTLISPLPQPTTTQAKVQPVSGARLVLLSDKKDYKVGDKVMVYVRLSTGGHTVNGADVILKYDPKILEIPNNSNIILGSLFEEYPINSVDSATGIIRMSGISGITRTGYNSIGNFANIEFKAKASGETNLNIDFAPGQTTDSNVIEAGSSQDILAEVFNLKLSVR